MTIEKSTIKCESVFSDNSQHRYSLTKIWDKSLPVANIITIAPSEDYNISCDLTTSLITNNVIMLGFGGFTLTNLISKVGANIKKVKGTKDLWDSETDRIIIESAQKADKIIIAWGRFAETRKKFSEREKNVLTLLKPFEEKSYQITDGGKREYLHPLTPSIRQGWVLRALDGE